MLVPALDEQSRTDQSRKVMRPYVSLQFEYNLADLQWKGEDSIELPARVRWETPRVEGSLTGTIKMVRVAGDWYFRSFDFLLFPWGEVILGGLAAIAFTVGVFWLVRRFNKRNKGERSMANSETIPSTAPPRP
jgi:hypothetical protein